jgi:general secretion pathway protein G
MRRRLAEIRDRPRFFSGFTLIELLVVMTIVALLLTLALPRYFGSVDKSKEAVLKENLHQMREAISRYYADKGRYPESLDTLASDKYLRRVPIDPITESTSTWQVVQPEDAQKSGVYDIRSGAPGKSRDGSEYSQW